MYHMDVGYPRGQKISLDSLELELNMAVTLHVGLGNWTCIHYESNKSSELVTPLSIPQKDSH